MVHRETTLWQERSTEKTEKQGSRIGRQENQETEEGD
jgi:hypothetical protein